MATKDVVTAANDDGAVMREISRGMDADNAASDSGKDGGGGFGTTAELSAPVGQGMSCFLFHLRHTGRIRDHSTNEEMHGQAKQAHYEEEDHNNQMVTGGRMQMGEEDYGRRTTRRTMTKEKEKKGTKASSIGGRWQNPTTASDSAMSLTAMTTMRTTTTRKTLMSRRCAA